MEERNFLSQYLILRSRDYGEGDKIVTMFSPERGKESAIAKGAARSKSSLRGVVQPFSHVRLAIAKGRGSLHIVTQGEVIESFAPLRQELEKITYASYLAELVDAGMPERKPNADLFLLALLTYSLLAYSEFSALTARYFELRFLSCLGLTPRLDTCLKCGRSIQERRFFLSPFHGGIVCETCAATMSSKVLIHAGTVQVLRFLQKSPAQKILNLKMNPQTSEELKEALWCYLDYHLDYTLRARDILDQIERS